MHATDVLYTIYGAVEYSTFHSVDMEIHIRTANKCQLQIPVVSDAKKKKTINDGSSSPKHVCEQISISIFQIYCFFWEFGSHIIAEEPVGPTTYVKSACGGIPPHYSRL